MIPTYLTRLLSDRPDLESYYGPLRLECSLIGDLHFPSGRIVACDPLDPSALPFVQAVPPGHYPIFLSVVHMPDGEERTAAAWLRVVEAAPVRWEHARWDVKSKVAAPAYAVDSGMGAFMSLEAAPLIEALGESLTDQIYAAMDSGLRGWVVLPVPGAEHLNFAMFDTGLGDGVYASYWGYDAAGRPVCLLTDFDVLGLPDAVEPAGPPPAKPWWKFW